MPVIARGIAEAFLDSQGRQLRGVGSILVARAVASDLHSTLRTCDTLATARVTDTKAPLASIVGSRLVDRSVNNPLNGASVIGDQQHIKHNELMSLAFEAVDDRSSRGDLLAVSSCAQVSQIA